MILGLDISTSIIGYTVLDKESNIIKCEAWDLRNSNNFENLYKKASYIKQKLILLDKEYGIDKVYIEEPFTFFKSGGSTAGTMAKLQSFNGTVSYLCYEVYGIEPKHISPGEARKANKIKVSKGEKAKEVVLDYLLKNEPGFLVEYTSKGNPKPETYDRADSLIIARAGLYINGA